MTRAEYVRSAGVALTYALALLDKAKVTGTVVDRLLAVKRDMVAIDAAFDADERVSPPRERVRE